jgi:hypothetical protein
MAKPEVEPVLMLSPEVEPVLMAKPEVDALKDLSGQVKQVLPPILAWHAFKFHLHVGGSTFRQSLTFFLRILGLLY